MKQTSSHVEAKHSVNSNDSGVRGRMRRRRAPRRMGGKISPPASTTAVSETFALRADGDALLGASATRAHTERRVSLHLFARAAYSMVSRLCPGEDASVSRCTRVWTRSPIGHVQLEAARICHRQTTWQ